MSAELWRALAPVLGLAVNSVALVLTRRFRPALGLLRAQSLSFAVGATTGVLLFAVFPPPPSLPRIDVFAQAFLGFASYTVLGYCHFHFVNLGETARRIRLLWELRAAGGTLSRNDLLARYSAHEIVEKRLSRLLGTGQIVRRGDRFFAGGPAVATMAVCMVWLKVLLLGRKHEHNA